MKEPIDAMLMMLPFPCSSMTLPNAWQHRYVPFRFSSMM